MKINLFFLILFLNIFYSTLNAQILSFNTGQVFHEYRTITPVLNQKNDLDNRYYYSINFDYYLKKKPIMWGISYSTFSGWVGFSFNGNGIWSGSGSSGTTIHRLGYSYGYNLTNKRKRISIIPYVKGILEYSEDISGGPVFSIRNIINPGDDPNYDGKITREIRDGFQVLPALGIKIDWNFLWRLHLHSSAYFAYGFRAYQKYYFEYNYDGVPQPTAEFHSAGTGSFFNIGLGFQFGKR